MRGKFDGEGGVREEEENQTGSKKKKDGKESLTWRKSRAGEKSNEVR
jgi:hypothetical protein